MSWSDIFLPDSAQTADEQAANYQRQQDLLEQRRQQRLAAGTLSDDLASRYTVNEPLEDQNAAAWQGAGEGAMEGLNNVLKFPGQVVGSVGDGLGTLLGGILKNVPWWAWLLAAGFLFFYLGGGILVRRKVASL